MKHLILTLALIVLIFSGCKKKATDTAPEADISGNWELVSQNSLYNGHFYQIQIIRNSTALSGDAVVRVDSTRHAGLISGSLSEGNLNLIGTFSSAAVSFNFTAYVTPGSSPASIPGKFYSSSLVKNGKLVATDVYLRRTLSKLNCDSTLPNNQYKFIKVLSTPNPTGPPVIFVHGMDATLKCWDTLIMNLSADFKLRHNVYVFQYDWKDSITVNGRALRDSVVAAGLASPILIGHSMGGLVSRAYIASGGTITKLVTLGTPHLGTPLVSLINLVCFANFPGPRQMYPYTGFIPQMLHNALDIANRSKYYVIAGQMTDQLDNTGHYQWLPDWAASIDRIGYDAFLLFGPPPNDGLVPVNSANFDTLNVPVNRPLPLQQWVDHFNLIQPGRAPQVLQFINSL
ncbi:MAG: alpha/beta fold hydrolase [Bacteroidota bacterium]|jgi:pimeloyl-ACP methyl ester carboxylesterase